MEKEEFEAQISKYAEEIGIVLTNKQINQFYQYMRPIIRMERKNQLNCHHKARRNHIKTLHRLHNHSQIPKAKRKTN